MKLPIIALAAAVGAAAVSTAVIAAQTSPFTTPPPPRGTGLQKGQCFRSHDIRSHTIADRQTILLSTGTKAVYRVTVDGACLGGAVSSDPIVTHEPPGNSIICKPIDLDLGVSKSGFGSKCIVSSIVQMSPAEVAALPKKLVP
jgi:hypothetical protein